jgi:hypothetical protein
MNDPAARHLPERRRERVGDRQLEDMPAGAVLDADAHVIHVGAKAGDPRRRLDEHVGA